jgi:hypothetical protein
MDEFVSIPDFPDYFINRKGDVLSKKWKKERIMKPNLGKSGYYYFGLRKDKKPYTKKTHRLLAEIFIKNPNNYLYVDHINRDRSDNRLENLRWVTYTENCQNKSKRKKSKSGYKHIHFYNTTSRWRVTIERNKKVVCDSRKFKTIEEAVSYRNKVLIELNEDIID